MHLNLHVCLCYYNRGFIYWWLYSSHGFFSKDSSIGQNLKQSAIYNVFHVIQDRYALHGDGSTLQEYFHCV